LLGSENGQGRSGAPLSEALEELPELQPTYLRGLQLQL